MNGKKSRTIVGGRGYRTEITTHEGQPIRRITTADGKVIRLGCDEQLLVINGVPTFVLKSPDEIFAAIRDYSSQHDLRTFVIADDSQSRMAVAAGEVLPEDEHIIFLSIVPTPDPPNCG